MTTFMSHAEARTWWRALMQNVVGLIEDASLLLDSGSAGRARSLLVLAQEELGKALWLNDAAQEAWTSGRGEVVLPSDFEQQARRHLPKLVESHQYGLQLEDFWTTAGDQFQEEPSANNPQNGPERQSDVVAREMNLQKQAGFYVDRNSGEVHAPSDITDEGIADSIKQAAGVAEMLLIEDHSRMKHDGASQPYDSTHDLQIRLIPFSHPDILQDDDSDG